MMNYSEMSPSQTEFVRSWRARDYEHFARQINATITYEQGGKRGTWKMMCAIEDMEGDSLKNEFEGHPNFPGRKFISVVFQSEAERRGLKPPE
jgi:hypothetical protein